ncbi:MAG: hypothetical protein WA061_05675 [Microgenomates group bacterium]
MKNEKFCFNKGTGLIALLGIVLVAAVFFMNYSTSTKQASNAKAFLNCPNSSLVDLTDKCPATWQARDANGQVIMASGPLGGQHPCCYLNTNYTGICPNGSSPDPNKWCKASRVVANAYVTRISDQKQVQCCNFIGSVDAVTPAVAASTPRPTTPLTQTAGFCTDIGLYNVPNDAENLTPRFVNDYYKLNCSGTENTKPLWNGSYGSFAKCYMRTGVCAGNANCGSTACLRGYDGKAGCVYQPVDMSKCMAAGSAPASALGALTCPPVGTTPVYLYDGGTNYYQQASRVCKTKGEQPYCCNQVLTSTQVTSLGLKPTAPNCQTSPKFGWGPMTKVINARTGITSSIYTCYQTNASNGSSCAANKVVAQEFCQCYVDFRGNMSTETCKYAKTLSL